MRPLDLRDDIGFALEGAWLRLAEAGDWAAERYESLTLPRWVPLAVAAVAIAVGLYAIQGSGESPTTIAANQPVAATPTPEAAPSTGRPAGGDATLIERAGFSLALPHGWVETEPPAGASFAVTSPDGLADATLWITEAPKLSFARFEEQSLVRLSELSGDARVVDRSEGPTLETTIVELAAGAEGPSADAPYRVTLRAAGPYRYYLATSLRVNAPAALVGDTELLRGTLRPDVRAEAIETR